MAIAYAFEMLNAKDLEQLLVEEDRTSGDASRLLCALCGEPITSRDHRIVMGGAHEHRFTNPHGMVFHIGCFSRAKGCAQMGKPTAEWTWFTGFEWRIDVCHRCRSHLGWGFRSAAGKEFFGLILSRLVEDENDH